MIVLDTHALLWADSGDRKLGRKTRAFIEREWAKAEVGAPSIAFWEVGLLVDRRRLRLSSALREWRDALLGAGLLELPLTGEIAIRALELQSLHDDPADRFIMATALVHGATLVTADERLLDWPYGLAKHDART
jgi:PIN domain nuclease of toxin-antitoxin system